MQRVKTIPIAQVPYVDFDASMRLLDHPEALTAEWGPVMYPMLKNLFEKNYRVPELDSPYRIPKILHQIWLGSPFPEKYKAFRDSWIRAHPDWQYKLWTEAEIEALGLFNKDLYDAAANYGAKSDIAKYEIIYRFGGVYIDTDYECIQALDLIHKTYDFYIGIQPLDTEHVQIGLGLFGARPGHKILGTVIQQLRANTTPADIANKQIVLSTGPLFFTPIFYQLAPLCDDRVIAFPASYLYPMGYNEKVCDWDRWIRPESFAVHHWEGSWLKPEGFIPAVRARMR
jgi:inositol phosphorylceramide mannosyltransferase catalytic subunit